MKAIIMILLFPLVWVAVGFIPIKVNYDCGHIYVATSSDTVESSCHIQGDYAIGGYGITVPGIVYNVGVHSQKHDEKNISEGINLVCVKCFHQTRQKIHYKHKE